MLFVAESTRDLMVAVPDDLTFFGEFEVRGKEAKIRIHAIPDPPEAPPLS